MPIIRYFVFVGGLLLALLFAADRYLPAPVETAAAADPDRTTIRISSARSVPEKIVFDTRPRDDVAKVAQADLIAEAPQEQVRQATAAMPAAPPRKSRPLASPWESVRVQSAWPSIREEHPSDGLPSTGTTHLPGDGERKF